MGKNKILVTGATGFIGQALIKKLAEQNIPFIAHNVIQLDVTNPSTFNFKGAEEINHVIHLAGKTFVPDSWKNPNEFLNVNTIGTHNVAEFCKNNNVSLTYISAYIYGSEVKNPIGEDHPINLNNPYALSKKLGEDICLFYANNFHLPISIVRPFNVYGENQNASFLIPEVIHQAKSSYKISVKDLSPKRDFIYVEDLCDLILSIYKKGAVGTFNAGTGVSYSVKELIDIIQSILGKNLPIESENTKRINEISDTVANISKAKNEIGWAPKFNLEAGLRKIILSN